jgi:1-acyl-sn-glycerol-3-phosphate acyltransferase
MQNFEGIRPYRDDEVAAVVRRLVHDQALLKGVASFFAPNLSRWLPWLARQVTQRFIERRTAHLNSVNDVQMWLARYMAKIIRDTIQELTVEGLDDLPRGRPYLFISNHRDIFMDAGVLNFSLHQAGHRTMRVAVGDNLLSESYAADLMRLNKSFVVERSASGTKAIFQAINRTSSYIRHSLEEGESVWIAQREGRTKNGYDRTDPALLKMLSLAYRKELERFGDLARRVCLVPVSVSYELEPCDLRKAHEICVIARGGRYVKAPGEDLASLVEGITGYKGRVHVCVGRPLQDGFADSEEMAAAIDRAIVGGMRVYPTHVLAARRASGSDSICRDSDLAPLPRVMRAFEGRLAVCPPEELPYLLDGYGNLLRNRRDLGID